MRVGGKRARVCPCRAAYLSALFIQPSRAGQDRPGLEWGGMLWNVWTGANLINTPLHWPPMVSGALSGDTLDCGVGATAPTCTINNTAHTTGEGGLVIGDKVATAAAAGHVGSC